MKLPEQYKWLTKCAVPRILREALNEYGVKEITGDVHNPHILAWADEIGGWIGDFYENDEIPWCGLFVAVCAKRSKFPFGQKALSAKAWLGWGTKTAFPCLGDILIFGRKGGGHVGFYVGEDLTHYHVLGGNQSNQVNIMRVSKTRLLGIRRCTWRFFQPRSVKPVSLSPEGIISENEK